MKRKSETCKWAFDTYVWGDVDCRWVEGHIVPPPLKWWDDVRTMDCARCKCWEPKETEDGKAED